MIDCFLSYSVFCQTAHIKLTILASPNDHNAIARVKSQYTQTAYDMLKVARNISIEFEKKRAKNSV